MRFANFVYRFFFFRVIISSSSNDGREVILLERKKERERQRRRDESEKVKPSNMGKIKNNLKEKKVAKKMSLITSTRFILPSFCIN